ncbi:hypothetical protein [Methanorbis rubei]|uniref:Uncharacterized protein n=1 Tax=Methanorbis rubei TaxID=3028300 RepID=A0AAE4MEU1_9EURY|nr:hypothetical protein [Methanocorpusculaceae archaeon Cs1]
MIPDYREESCTYLMLRLKVALKKHDQKTPFSFYGTATQVKTVEGSFPASGYTVASSKEGDDCYLITLSSAET